MLVSGQQQLQQLLNLFSENVPGFFFQLYRKPEGSFQLQLVSESAAQRDALAALGCYHYQGFYFSRPLPGGDFVALHRRSVTH